MSTRTRGNYGSLREAAERFGVCERTIRRRVSDGTITGYRIGPRILRVDLDEVEKAFTVPIPAVNRD